MIKEDSLISDIKEHFNTLLNARSLAISNDKRILEFLLEKSQYKNEYKERFFQTQYGALIFKKDEFLNFLDLRLLSFSYTSFSNKIGLGVSEKRFLKNSENVVLNFPFKDCVLKGAQSKDDEKNTELFFNNILAKSEIDVLFAPKVLNKFELIGGGDLETTLKNRPNLLIKGNNLIALHSLKEYFRHQSEQNKVKLIYIDPPYNTGSDSFNYNDRFNHSTYLTFMKNRLEIARELLRDDGVIFVQCDDNEQAYLKVLMDEIFGRENFVSCSIFEKVKIRKNSAKYFSESHEYILIFSKHKENWNRNLLPRKDTSGYKNPDNDPRGVWIPVPIHANHVYEADYKITKPNGVVLEKPKNNSWRLSEENFKKHVEENRIWWGKDNSYPMIKKFLSEVQDGLVPRTIFYYDETGGGPAGDKALKDLFEGNKVFDNPKPEKLLEQILEISTQENDLVLDFFAGSGTTLAVAHKMKRRYIGIEQMEYIESITKERLKKVIEGEQGGISKAVSWSGGGNLIYCELASLNAKFIEKIENSSDENELNQIYENLQKLAFIDYRVDIKNDLKDDEFSNLDFTSKKRILKKCLDRNMDYIPYADIKDSEYKIDEQTRVLNDIFYKGGNDE
ncbi:type III restriction/modification system, mod subunit [Campylobacter hyointestinalis subsp. lawsonii CCUG 27631]|uniref:site-specific DNA-methyltransferase n=1 Tax=Campylobacter hyointestinalis TaxID=198 RepID=UPI0007C8C65D|nr:site-specific DNA-methyltransferase [Campylobacter hyointestinalis]ANE34397.1 type III restriction/modification system, mod subunit [Campylobacter hyointestinalis subsp. lawsonii CCUG 27631]